jgi:hypothetical protein
MNYDRWQPPSRPHTTFPQTRQYGHGPARAATTSRQSLQRHDRSTLWFQLYRRGGRVILYHSHIRPFLIRDWSRPMDGIAATIWASQTTLHLETAGSAVPVSDHAHKAFPQVTAGGHVSLASHSYHGDAIGKTIVQPQPLRRPSRSLVHHPFIRSLAC